MIQRLIRSVNEKDQLPPRPVKQSQLATEDTDSQLSSLSKNDEIQHENEVYFVAAP